MNKQLTCEKFSRSCRKAKHLLFAHNLFPHERKSLLRLGNVSFDCAANSLRPCTTCGLSQIEACVTFMLMSVCLDCGFSALCPETLCLAIAIVTAALWERQKRRINGEQDNIECKLSRSKPVVSKPQPKDKQWNVPNASGLNVTSKWYYYYGANGIILHDLTCSVVINGQQ